MADIAENIRNIRSRIDAAAQKAGRDPDSILLLAVTKLHEAEEINEAVKAGITDIGENKVQELTSKYDQVVPGVRWHLIGTLQTNKVKSIADKVCMIHSVDSVKLAKEIEKRCSALDRSMDILLEINCAGEEAKGGVSFEEALPLAKEILSSCPHLVLKGLMTVAPAADDPEEVRPYFARMKTCYDRWKEELAPAGAAFEYLSMGMSHDFEIDVKEGANIVRVGTAIFGKRDYSKKM